jgi:hypothetical protein
LRWPRDTLYPLKLALTLPTSGGRSVDRVRLRTTGHGVCFFKLLYLAIYGFTALVDLRPIFSVLILVYTQSVGLLGQGISPSQGLYLQTEQHKHRIKAHRHPCLEWDSNPRSQCSRGRRRFMP